ncbi:site-specific integrase [Nocardiopsis sp. L17-MgMaSL7]|uniref:tyrosine-type recombinase/integrase n=1 Tax=Nocardiopsis sp. L17-MgMaSL7 TaxID=1938893 RepID=UPI000D9615B0|nr:site-specific integrase [Nocardiopsis sp. L17-MgMaSL7]PWV49226.1 site-specific recombinase XerD [Nocardiopsis sp. L17-MgMaSL7]
MARIRDLWKNKDGSRSTRDGIGKRWCVVWTDPAGDEKNESFAKKPDAERFKTQIEHDLMVGDYIDPDRGKTALSTYVAEKWWPAQVHLADGTRETYDRHLRNRILPALGARSLNSIRKADVKEFVGRITGTVSARTVQTTWATLSTVLSSAVDDELIRRNPCAGVKLPKIPERDVIIFPAADVLRVAETISPRYRLAVLLAAGAGLRQGEALGLAGRRVDVEGSRLLLREQMQGGKLAPLKTKGSRRTVPVDSGLLAEITAHMDAYPPGADGVLITNTKGAAMIRGRFVEAWAKGVERAGLPKGTRFHDLRHFYASALIAAQVNAKVLQRRMGHASITETFDTYGHLFPDHEDIGRGVLDQALNLAA